MTRRRYMRVVFALWGAAIVLAVVGWARQDLTCRAISTA